MWRSHGRLPPTTMSALASRSTNRSWARRGSRLESSFWVVVTMSVSSAEEDVEEAGRRELRTGEHPGKAASDRRDADRAIGWTGGRGCRSAVAAGGRVGAPEPLGEPREPGQPGQAI